MDVPFKAEIKINCLPATGRFEEKLACSEGGDKGSESVRTAVGSFIFDQCLLFEHGDGINFLGEFFEQ